MWVEQNPIPIFYWCYQPYCCPNVKSRQCYSNNNISWLSIPRVKPHNLNCSKTIDMKHQGIWRWVSLKVSLKKIQNITAKSNLLRQLAQQNLHCFNIKIPHLQQFYSYKHIVLPKKTRLLISSFVENVLNHPCYSIGSSFLIFVLSSLAFLHQGHNANHSTSLEMHLSKTQQQSMHRGK